MIDQAKKREKIIMSKYKKRWSKNK